MLLQRAPALTLRKCSERSGLAPSVPAIGSATGTVRSSKPNWPLTLVLPEENQDCASAGTRAPVAYAPWMLSLRIGVSAPEARRPPRVPSAR